MQISPEFYGLSNYIFLVFEIFSCGLKNGLIRGLAFDGGKDSADDFVAKDVDGAHRAFAFCDAAIVIKFEFIFFFDGVEGTQGEK